MNNKPTITRGADFSLTFQITTEPYVEGLLIESSSIANPCVVTTQLPHQLATSDHVRISGHRDNTIINGIQIVTVIDAFNFSVPVAGIIEGLVTGRVGKAIDITGFTISVLTKNQHGGTVISNATSAIAIISAVDGECQITLAKTQTPNIFTNSCVLEVTYTDLSGKVNIFSIECEVKNA